MGQAMLKNCPVCQKPSIEKFRPFCSGRCADVDLGKWFNENYSVPAGKETDLEEGEDLES